MSHANLLDAHATVAVFGAILTTVYGALYSDRLEAIDFGLLLGGTGLMVSSELWMVGEMGTILGSALVGLGVVVFIGGQGGYPEA